MSTNRLDENLHALMLHSLSESGLDFPHVQRSRPNGHFNYEKHRNPSGSDSRTTVTPLQLDGRDNLARKHGHVIQCREEGTDGTFQPSARVSGSPSGDQRGGETSPDEPEEGGKERRTTRWRERSTRPQPTDTLDPDASKPRRRNQTLELARVGLDHPLRKSVRGRRRRSSDADLDGDAVDQSFQAARSKIDHRTLAILDKTKALLDHTPAKGEARVSVAELRDRYRAAASQLGTSTGKKSARSSNDKRADHQISTSDSDVDNCSSGADDSVTREREGDATGTPRAPQSSSRSRSRDEGHEEEETAQQSGKLEKTSPVRCDIDLLRAPDRPPDDDNEWENELARQTLTIYATSVKAKAAAADSAASRPPSGAARGKTRPSATPSRGSRRPEISACSLPALNQQQRLQTGSDGFRQSKTTSRPTASVNYSWEPSQRLDGGKVVVNMPSIPKPIWFAGTGAVKAVWCALTEGYGELTAAAAASSKSDAPLSTAPRASMLCSHRLCEEVQRM